MSLLVSSTPFRLVDGTPNNYFGGACLATCQLVKNPLILGSTPVPHYSPEVLSLATRLSRMIVSPLG